MIRLFLLGMKLGVMAAVILLISQIPVGTQRICDHVRDFTRHAFVQGPVQWVSRKFDFVGERFSKTDRAQTLRLRATHSSRAAGSESEHGESVDKERLSGLLKKSPGH